MKIYSKEKIEFYDKAIPIITISLFMLAICLEITYRVAIL